MITKQYALRYIKGENKGTKIRTESDGLYASCVKWDPALRKETAGDGHCGCCALYWLNDCEGCPLFVEGSDCCGDAYDKWVSSFTGTIKEAEAVIGMFEFIKAKYKEVSGKDYE